MFLLVTADVLIFSVGHLVIGPSDSEDNSSLGALSLSVTAALPNNTRDRDLSRHIPNSPEVHVQHRKIPLCIHMPRVINDILDLAVGARVPWQSQERSALEPTGEISTCFLFGAWRI